MEKKSSEMNYLIMRITPSIDNGLSTYSNAYLSNEKMPSEGSKATATVLRKRFIVIEVQHTADFDSLLHAIRDNDTLGPYIKCDGKLGSHDKDEYITALLAPAVERRTRSSASTSVTNRATFKEEETVLVFPFDASTAELDSAARGLTEASGRLSLSDENVTSLAIAGADNCADAAATSKTHMVTIRGEDFDRLVPCEFLNDTLIDFWINW